MEKKKMVLLFGAGAALDWGGPLTLCDRDKLTIIPDHGTGKLSNRVCCLTHLILATGFYAADGSRITEKIFLRLKEKKPNAHVNFETILNVIEDLYAYWNAQFDKEATVIYNLLALDEDLKELHYFEEIPHVLNHIYQIKIPGFDLVGSALYTRETPPVVKYYELLLNELLGGIVGHISKYGYSSPNHDVLDKGFNKEINDQFGNWMQGFLSRGYDIRLFTLNYDDNFKRLLEKQNVNVFDGFEKLNDTHNFYAYPALREVVEDRHAHVHYNLHGSWYWEVKAENENQLPGYQYLKAIPGIIEGSAASIAIEKGKRILLTNIISGYQKVQKTAISPFRQLFSALDKDCFEADEIYIIGYSFGDEHINDIIRQAKKHRPDLKITIISPSFDETQFSIDFITNWGMPQFGIYNWPEPEIIESRQFGITAVLRKFKDYLSDPYNNRKDR